MNYYEALGAVHSRLPRVDVDIPKPKAPDSDDIKHKGEQGGDWLASRDESFWQLVIVAVGAAVLITIFRRSAALRWLIIGLAVGWFIFTYVL